MAPPDQTREKVRVRNGWILSEKGRAPPDALLRSASGGTLAKGRLSIRPPSRFRVLGRGLLLRFWLRRLRHSEQPTVDVIDHGLQPLVPDPLPVDARHVVHRVPH